MIGDKDQFVTLEIKKERVVAFGDNDKSHIVGIGKIQITPLTFLENIFCVRELKHNLISTSQLCDKGFKVSFEAFLCIVTNPFDDSTIIIGHRQCNVYIIDLNDISTVSHCLIAIEAKINEISWLWHKRLGHTSTHLISKLIKRGLVKGISNLSIEEDKICDACQLKK